MRVLTAFNARRAWGGEDLMVQALDELLRARGVEVHSWRRDLGELRGGLAGRLGALASSIYSVASRRAMDRIIDRFAPDVVHAHNLYPSLSPSVLAAARRRGIPALLHCHSYLLTCPVTFHYREGAPCERCLGGREWWCAIHDCRANRAESVAYAIRNLVTRSLGLLRRNVSAFVTPSEFAKRRLVGAGFPEDRVQVLPNAVTPPERAADPTSGDHVLYVGRLSPEKGVATLIEAAALLPGVGFRVVGDGPARASLAARAPANVTFSGWVTRDRLAEVYRGARVAVVPSRWDEPFGLVAIEAMSHGVPVVAARTGALGEIVDDGVAGLLFDPGDARDLAVKLGTLWRDRGLSRRLGAGAREKALREYSPDSCFRKLMAIYSSVRDAPARACYAGAALPR